MAKATKRARQRGSIRKHGTGFQVRVYVGLDPITKHRIELVEHAADSDEAEKVRTRLLHQVDEQRAPKSDATIGQILDRWLSVVSLDDSSRARTEDLIRLYLRPTFGGVKAAKLTAEALELFYGRLRRCSQQCDGRRNGKADPDHPGEVHRCKPLAANTVRKIHFILRPALARAVRWHYVGVNAAAQAEPPAFHRRDPDPPSAAEAARLLNTAWARDLEWGCLLFLAMVTGCRRGELCGVRWADVDFEGRVINFAHAGDDKRKLKDTKTHQHRRAAFDDITAEMLTALRERALGRCRALGVELPETAFVFSLDPDGAQSLLPHSVTQRYRRLAVKLGLRSTRLHALRHYSATELIAAGVDLRTVAGRLGHGSGGGTTLRIYSAWVPESDRRAADTIAARLPLPAGLRAERKTRTEVNGHVLACPCGNATTWADLEVTPDGVTATCAACGQTVTAGTRPDAQVADLGEPKPYQIIAARLRSDIAAGTLAPGAAVPTVKDLANDYGVALSTAHRAVAMLADEGLVSVSRGKRATVASST